VLIQQGEIIIAGILTTPLPMLLPNPLRLEEGAVFKAVFKIQFQVLRSKYLA
jgi:hypothetical protein